MSSVSKTFTFPKIAFYGTRRINTPEIEVELRDTAKGQVLSICGSVWNSKHTDCLMCGQCLDEMNKFESLRHNPTFRKLYEWWKAWHLNDMCPASRSQEDALIAKFGKIPAYNEACDYLKSIDLYKDENGYEYGSAWLYREIPDEDLNAIKDLISE